MTNRTIIYLFAGGLVLLLIFFLIGKAYGKSMPPKPVEVPEDSGGTSGAQLSDAAIQTLVNDLKEDIYSYGTRNSAPYVTLLALSNTDFVRAYNDWNSRYYQLDKETLKQAIAGEWFSSTSFTFANIKDDLMTRFTNLGLS